MNITLLLKKCGVSVRYPVSQFAEQQHKVKDAKFQSHHIEGGMAKLTAAIVLVLEIHLSSAVSARKPHIVLIVADDLVLPSK